MDRFKAIRLRIRTIERYKGFSKKMTKSYSETLEVIMDFFEWHGISHFSRFASQIVKEEEKTCKRIDAVIAIIKDIGKNQTKPTTVMLLSLFGEKFEEEQEPVLEEKKFVKFTRDEWNEKEKAVPKIEFDRPEQKYLSNLEKILITLNRIEKIEPRFGKQYHKIDISPMDMAMLKRIFNDQKIEYSSQAEQFGKDLGLQ
jgi:hypothetical protein